MWRKVKSGSPEPWLPDALPLDRLENAIPDIERMRRATVFHPFGLPPYAAGGQGLPDGPRRWAMLAIWVAMVMAVLDAAIANVALPAMAGELDVLPEQAIWIVNSYQLAIVASLLPLAALGQIVTFRRIFLIGLALFTLASVGCSESRTLAELVSWRAIQGFGAAGIMSCIPALLRFVFPSARLGRAIGLNVLVIAIASAAGPSVAAVILAFSTWHMLFAINLPIGIVALIVGWFALPRTPRVDDRLDLVATLLNVVAFGLIVAGVDSLTREKEVAGGGLEIAIGIIAGWFLVRRSKRQPRPLVPVDLLANRHFGQAVAISVASFTAQTLAFVGLPFHLQGELKLDQVTIGLLLTAWPAAGAITAPLAGRLSDRFPAGPLAASGLGLIALGLFLLSLAGPATPHSLIALEMLLCGAGVGLFQSPNNHQIMSTAPEDRAGAASGMSAVARLTGQIAGASLAAALFAATSHGGLWSIRTAFVIALLGAAIALAGMAKARRPRAG